jgi:WXG100 family type VII secretion target
MAGTKIRWDYDGLHEIARLFDGEADKLRRSLDELKRCLAALEGGDWVGEGAQAFYSEMHTTVLPAFGRLVTALGEGAKTTLRIRELGQASEDEASRALSRQHGQDTAAFANAKPGDGQVPSSAGSAAGSASGATGTAPSNANATPANPISTAASGAATGAATGAAAAAVTNTGNYTLSGNARTVPDANWERSWNNLLANNQNFADQHGQWAGKFDDRTPLSDIKTTRDSAGNIKVFSFKANMAIDSDGDTPKVLGMTRLSQIRSSLKAQHNNWSDAKLTQESRSQLRQEAQSQGKYYDYYKQDDTALHMGGQALNADEVPYISIPPEFASQGNVSKGDLVLVRYGNHSAYAVVGDIGPHFKSGEASMRTARALGIGDDPSGGAGNGVADNDQGVEYIVLPGAGSAVNITAQSHTYDEIQQLGEDAFRNARQGGFVN